MEKRNSNCITKQDLVRAILKGEVTKKDSGYSSTMYGNILKGRVYADIYREVTGKEPEPKKPKNQRKPRIGQSELFPLPLSAGEVKNEEEVKNEAEEDEEVKITLFIEDEVEEDEVEEDEAYVEIDGELVSRWK